MPKNLPKIALIFAGGATIQTDKKRFISVEKASDADAWLSEVPELGLIADVEPVFLFEDGKEISPEDWNTLSEKIHELYKQYDGFVVLHGLDSILYSSAALSFTLQNLTKSIVFTGSPLTPDMRSKKEISGFIADYRTLGVRANLINSIQVATMYVPEVTILLGNQLLRANRSRKTHSASFNVFEADERDVLGTVDFGIRLKHEYKKTKGKIYFTELDSKAYLAVVRIHPGFEPEEFADIVKEKPDAIILHTYLQQGIKKNLDAYARICAQQDIPLLVFNPFATQASKREGLHLVTGLTYEALYTKTLWALGQRKGAKEIVKMLQQNIAQEIEEERRGE